jgi:hypothetical protein
MSSCDEILESIRANLARLDRPLPNVAPVTENRGPRLRYVVGPDGSPLTIADLPPSNTKRWVIRRKAEVVAAVRGGLLSFEDARKRYALTIDEFLRWHRLIERHGLPGLRATKIQDYRSQQVTALAENRTRRY